MTAEGATWKFDHQNNSCKGACFHQENNGDAYYCAIRALGHHCFHIWRHKLSKKNISSAYFSDVVGQDVTDQNIRDNIKCTAKKLEYPVAKGIPITRIGTHSLRSRGTNALDLPGYYDTQIQKIGNWRGDSFKEYIRQELAWYSKIMPRDTKRKFNFVNIAGGAYHDVNSMVMLMDYTTQALEE